MTEKLYKYATEYRKAGQPVTAGRFEQIAKTIEKKDDDLMFVRREPVWGVDPDDASRLVVARPEEETYLILAEELGELLQAMSKFRRDENSRTKQNLVEEVADVLISIECLKQLANIKEAELTDMIHHKMQRNLKRIDHDKKSL